MSPPAVLAYNSPPMNTSARLRAALGVAVTLVFLYVLDRYVGWARLWQPWAALSAGAVGAALALLLTSYLLRAARLYDYFHGDMAGRFPLCLRLTLWHNLLNNLLPMRTGELSFPVLMSRYFQVPAIRSVPALLWFRFLDLHTLAALGGAAALGLTHAPAWTGWLWLAWLPLPWLAYRLGLWLAPRLAGGHLHSWRHLAEQALGSLPTTGRALWRSWAWTVVNWSVKLAVFAWLLGQFTPLPLPAGLLGAIGGELSSVLPVHGVAGLGTYEAGVVAGLALWGVAAVEALAAAVNLHLFLLGGTLLGGLLALVLPRGPHD